eukprot:gnl/TRDRNA2_/TRDRNA2_176308_c4_seq7.p1 gnl/TRDRNA2_/TRDRNA2_176308_c4~~gnl/TRDRNA2_/TRDRNA2_176308_c4_seq7.p1  ORF type:complete len:314 (+),score=49.47 gnl/TRDRNA2_/TRDRNA2_176308_c4_seq7:221-1162(+)
MAWAFATAKHRNEKLFTALAIAAQRRLREFNPQDVANTAWAFESLSVRNRPLFEAISAQALKKLPDMQAQSLTFLVDVKLDCHDAVESELRKTLTRFISVMPKKGEPWDQEVMKQAVWDIHIDSFGHIGSRLLWDALGVAETSNQLVKNAQKQIDDIIREDDAVLVPKSMEQGSSRKHQRVFSYAEYELEPPADEQGMICGKMLFENGFRTTRADPRWFKHTPLPINTWVDRSLCAEAQMLAEFCTQLQKEGLAGNPDLNALLHGTLAVFTSAPPCLSCVGVLWQFKLSFPNVELQFSSGVGRGLEAWMSIRP